MSEVIHLELDCVNGEKLIFHRSNDPKALIEVTLDGKKVQVQPQTFWLAVVAFSESEIGNPQSEIGN